MSTDIQNFYAGSNVLITGATGFVGLCLLEKFLRCVPDIKSVYILIRPKRNKTANMRLQEIMQDEIFNTLKSQKGSTPFAKLIPITGDISEEKLGLTIEDEANLIINVNFVFHCAASLDFQEKLKNILVTNLLGTRRLIQLSKKMVSLKAFIHVSTAYVNFNKKYANEIIYPLPNSNDRVIELIDNFDEETLKNVMPMISEGHPNPYTFTKSLAEIEITELNDSFPTAIIRPSMITGTWKEPVPGWTNSKNGPQGFLMAAAKGIVRRLPVDKNLIYDYIPVDIVINEIISSAWYVAKYRPNETLIFHCTTSTCKPFKWSYIEQDIPRLLNSYPLKSAIWYPTLKLIPSMMMFRVSAFVFHMIPAYILDFLNAAIGKKPVLVKLHKNINKSLEKLSPFIFTEWKFHNSNTLMLHEALSSADKEKFGVDVKSLDWKSYFNNLALGVRQYLNKEDPSTIFAAKKRLNTLWWLNIFVQFIVIQLICFMFCIITGSLLSSLWIIPVILFFYNFF